MGPFRPQPSDPPRTPHRHGLALAGVLAALAATAPAAEGDWLLEVSPFAVERTGAHLSLPGLGTSLGFLSGFNDRTDLGFAASVERIGGLDGQHGLVTSTVALQGMVSFLRGDVRPQAGLIAGVALDDQANATFHLGVRLRGLMETDSRLRLFLGGTLGRDLGDRASTFARGEIGLQFLVQ